MHRISEQKREEKERETETIKRQESTIKTKTKLGDEKKEKERRVRKTFIRRYMYSTCTRINQEITIKFAWNKEIHIKKGACKDETKEKYCKWVKKYM